MEVEWDKLPEACRKAATLWAEEYGEHVDPDALQDVTVAVALGLYVANLGGAEDERERLRDVGRHYNQCRLDADACVLCTEWESIERPQDPQQKGLE